MSTKFKFDLQRFAGEAVIDNSTKSYTLADGSTVTVTSTENGVPFNEGMQALTKAIKARVAVRDGSGTGGASGNKQVPTLTFNNISYSPNSYSDSYTVSGANGYRTISVPTGTYPYIIYTDTSDLNEASYVDYVDIKYDGSFNIHLPTTASYGVCLGTTESEQYSAGVYHFRVSN